MTQTDERLVGLAELDQIGSGVLIKAPNRNAFYLLPSSFRNSLYCRLLFADPAGFPAFQPLAYVPAVGGIWRIPPRAPAPEPASERKAEPTAGTGS